MVVASSQFTQGGQQFGRGPLQERRLPLASDLDERDLGESFVGPGVLCGLVRPTSVTGQQRTGAGHPDPLGAVDASSKSAPSTANNAATHHQKLPAHQAKRRCALLSVSAQFVEEAVDDVQLPGADGLVVDVLADGEVENAQAEG